MASGDDKPEKRTQAEVERAEARAAERARREARRRKRAEKAKGEKAKGEKKDGPGWRERLGVGEKTRDSKAAEKPGDESRGDVIQRRVAAVAILLVVAVVIMALTDTAPFFDDTSEEERVADPVERFFAAYRDGDHEQMCSLFSPDVRQAIEQTGATETKGEDPESCAEIIAARVGAPAEDEKISVKVDEVRVSGPRAIANIVLKTPDSARRQIEAVELEQGPDGWLLTSPVITS
jgi:ketosteroid isomerase-like protein